MATIFEQELTNTEARGRNGCFRATRAVVRRYARNGEPRVTLDVASARPYQDMPPIHLDMAVKDAVALHNLLGRAIRAGAGGDLFTQGGVPVRGTGLRRRLRGAQDAAASASMRR